MGIYSSNQETLYAIHMLLMAYMDWEVAKHSTSIYPMSLLLKHLWALICPSMWIFKLFQLN